MVEWNFENKNNENKVNFKYIDHNLLFFILVYKNDKKIKKNKD